MKRKNMKSIVSIALCSSMMLLSGCSSFKLEDDSSLSSIDESIDNKGISSSDDSVTDKDSSSNGDATTQKDISSNSDSTNNKDISSNSNSIDNKGNSDFSASNSADLSKVYTAFADYLENNPLGYENNAGDFKDGKYYVYTLEYVAEDNTPDLVYSDISGVHGSNIYVLRYLDGKVVKSGPFGSYGYTSFYEKQGIFCTSDSGMDVEGTYYSKLTSNEDYEYLCKEVTTLSFNDEGEEKSSETKYYVREKEVSKDEYTKFVDENCKGEPKKWSGYENENNYTYINKDSLNELRNKQ